MSAAPQISQTPPAHARGAVAVDDRPPLENGDRLTRPEFLRRYHAMPRVHKAQLIEGSVYMPSPVNHRNHGRPHSILNGWLFHYLSKTPGVDLGDNSTTGLDEDNVPQPDLLLRVPERAGGRSKENDRGYLDGPPELVAEIASSSVSLDLHAKLNAYRRNGVLEYLVWRVRDEAVDWFSLDEGHYVPLPSDETGQVVKSQVFPGLWLDARALLAGDLPALLAAVDRGCEQKEHGAFVQRLHSVTE